MLDIPILRDLPATDAVRHANQHATPSYLPLPIALPAATGHEDLPSWDIFRFEV
jgi:hypothetical protein